MPYYTPLRYPGGKRRLAKVIMRLIEANDLRDIHYAEPYAGGASIALALLFGEYASVIHINDLSRPVYAFWYMVLNDCEALCRRIERVDVTMSEWRRQRAIYERRETADIDDLGFAAFFLNRTNRSGIINGGVIGGQQQDGDWTLDARFNRTELIQRIRRIARYNTRIRLYQLDALDFTNRVVSQFGRNSLSFYDPP
jgi:DNA adenine methylase